MEEQYQLVMSRDQELDLLIAGVCAGKRGPWPLANREKVLLWKLKNSRGHQLAVKAAVLAKNLNCTERDVKAMVKNLVENFEVPIGASRGEPAGYYLVMTEQEMEDTVRAYVNEIRSLARRVRAFAPAQRVVELLGQIRLDLGPKEAA